LTTVNGKIYPLWSQFIERKNEWIGGKLHDLECDPTELLDIQLNPNGEDSAYFLIKGKDYDCGFDVSCGGIAPGNGAGLTFSGMYGLNFKIYKANEEINEYEDEYEDV
jgi:hypothetical protein